MTAGVFGDWNLAQPEVEAIARRAAAQFVPGQHIDNAIVLGAKKVVAVPLGKHGSDHPAVLYRITLPNGEEFRVLAWNVYVARHPRDVHTALMELIDQTQPHAVALSEAYRCHTILGFVTGYRRLQGALPLGENRDCALLLRNDLKVLRSGISRMKQRWVGPKHAKAKGPRRFPHARVQTASGQVVRLMAAHLPTGGPTSHRNGAAVRESIARIVTWLNPNR